MIIVTRFECIQQQFIKFQKKKKQRKSQTKPVLFSPATSFFHHHHNSLDPDANTDEQRQVRRKSRATTLKLSQTTHSQDLTRQQQIRKSIKNHTTLTIISNNSNQQTTPESNKHRNTIRKQSQFVSNLIAPQTSRHNFNTNQSDHGSRTILTQQSDNKKMNPCFLYFPLIKGFIQLTHNQPLILVQSWERLILQLIYVDLMVFYEFVFIPVFFIANRLIHKIIRKVSNNYSERIIVIGTIFHIIIIICGQIAYVYIYVNQIIFAKFNFLTIIINLIDIIGIDLLIYCIFRLYRVTETKQDQDLNE